MYNIQWTQKIRSSYKW